MLYRLSPSAINLMKECPKCNSSAGWDNGYCSMCGFREIKNGK